MKKANKLAASAFVVLLVITVIVYFLPHGNPRIEGGIVVEGAVGNPENFTVNQIEAFTQVTVQVTLMNRPNPLENGVFNYTGITLKSLLDQTQTYSNATSVFVQAPDGYAVTLSIQDAQKATTILAYQKDGVSMTPLSAGGEGPVRLVMGDQHFPHDWVKDVSLIEIR